MVSSLHVKAERKDLFAPRLVLHGDNVHVSNECVGIPFKNVS